MKMIKNKFRAIFFASVVLLLAAQPVLAQGIIPCGTRSGPSSRPCEWSDLFEITYRVVNYLIGMAGFVAIFYIVWGGLQMLMSAGNTTRVQEAKSTVWNAVLGLVLTLLAYLIIGYVVSLFLPGGGAGNPITNIMDYLPRRTAP